MSFKKIFTTTAFITRVKRQVRDENQEPLQVARQLAKETVISYLLQYGLGLLLVIAVLIILGFTDLLAGPFVLAQVMLFLVGGSTILFAIGGWWLWRKGKQQLEKFAQQSESTDRYEDVTEVTVIEGSLE